MTVASVEEIRAHFPALSRVHNGQPVAYFDGPGGTQVPTAVADAMVDYLFHHNANTEWAYPTSAETDEALAGARAAVGDFLNASPDEIAFGANMTTLTFHLSRALGRQLVPGDEIIVTELDHHANVDPWRELAREKNLCVRAARLIPETGQIDWDHLEDLVNARTQIIAVGLASNALGTVNSVERAIKLARDCDAYSVIDAVHYAPHSLADVRALDCDFLLCSAYKFYGPHVGILYGKKDLLDDTDFPRLVPAHHAGPERAETGTLNHEGIVGSGAAVDFIASLAGESGSRRERAATSFSEIHKRNMQLFAQLWDGLSSVKGLTLYGPDPKTKRTPTLSFTLAGRHSREIAERLATLGLFCSHGDFYAKTVVDRLGVADVGLLRVGCAMYSTTDEISRLVNAVQEL